MKRLVVGLAGGVGSGKSTIAQFFRKWGVRIVDADAIGHRVLDDPTVRARLARLWGRGILRGGRVDRAALARAAFRSKDAVARLNGTVHPAILREIRRQVSGTRGCVLLDAALLYETGSDRLCDRMIFVDAPRAVRARRTAARGWSPGELARRERFQWPAAYKKKRADYVINNTGPKSNARKRACTIFHELQSLL